MYQRILVNTYRTSDLCRPRGRTRPPSGYCNRRAIAISGTTVDLPGFGRVRSGTTSGTTVDLPGFGRVRTDMSDREDDTPATRGALQPRAPHCRHLKRRPSSLGLDHACVCITSGKTPLAQR